VSSQRYCKTVLLASVDFLDIVESLFLMPKHKSKAQRLGFL
jgi:hypothetical protein